MSKRWWRSCALACWLAMAGVRAWGVQATLVADAHVSSAQPNVNSGTLSNLNVGGGYTSLVQFDLGVLPAGLTAAQVQKATLRLYCNRADTAGSVSVATVGGAWSEYGVTYATLPAVGSAIANANASAGAFVTFDVTVAVQGWVSGASTNNGLALTAATAVVQFDSKENDQTAHAPQLEIALAAGGGASGVAGATGATGAAGVQGIQGVAGATGATGSAGVAGSTGAAGAAGAKGATGSTGVTGSSGANGVAGATGAAGVTGSTGATGGVGSTGAAGATGVAGATGSAGQKGDQGAQGIAGQAGAQGIQGVTGATGAQGPVGSTGVAGPTGLSFRGAYDSSANYALGDGVLWQGAGWVSLVAGNHGNAPDQSPATWTMFAAVGSAGSAGATGATGASGVAGVNGATGATGSAGVAGSTGATGAAGLVYQGAYSSVANYALGDVVVFGGSSYASLVASNHGNTPGVSASAWSLLAAMGSVGATGVAGPVGATGATGIGLAGPTGAQGVAGVQGPTGTQGPAGAQGLLGATGAKGDAGSTGAQGVAGQGGAQGVQGVTGATGLQGVQGVAGVQGVTGATGSTGAAGAVGMNFRNAWNAGTNYNLNDAVTYGGATYLAVSASTNQEPDVSAQSWTVIAQAGGAGPTGAAASVSIGTVTALAAGATPTVTNSGSSQSAVLNFGIPQGATGATGAAGSGGGTTSTVSGASYAAFAHSVSFSSTYYSVNTALASASESAIGILEWVPRGCTAKRLDVQSLQSGTITVTLRMGDSLADMVDTTLVCTIPVTATTNACPATGSVAIPAGDFIDLKITGASGSAAAVWTALECD